MINFRMILVFALAFAAVSCSSTSKDAAAEPGAAPVQTAKAVKEPIQHVVTASAILYPLSQASVTPKITAAVRQFYVNRGDHVHKGQLLAELESRDLAATANESRALYQQAEAQYRTLASATVPDDTTKAKTDVESAKQNMDAAQHLYDNRVSLLHEGAIARKLVDDAKVALVQAQSQYQTAARHLESLTNVGRAEQIKAAQAQVDAAQAHYVGAQVQVSYTELRSPIDGVVADRPAYVGDIVSSGSPAITILNIAQIIARANIPVKDVGHLKAGNSASIAGPDGDIPGKVTVVSPAVDPNSTTVEVWIRVDNPDQVLKPGGTAQVKIRAEAQKDAVVVPVAALLSSEDGKDIVKIVGSDSVVHDQEVETGIREGDKLQILKGVEPGQQVVTVGGLGLDDKSKVRVENSTAGAKAGGNE
jgi:multidrug efflux pump subunit AcrA (membrane-fusion protein)